MRVMADSTNAADLPTNVDLYAGYVDGRWQSYEPAVARFGTAKVVPIAVFSSTNDGVVGDCENGDMTPPTAVSWVVMRRNAGVDPTIYCSLSAWGAVRSAFAAAAVPEPHYWIAAYPGNGQQLYPGTIAHQYEDVGNYDLSVVADHWPGVDAPPAPAPDPTHYSEDNMTSTPTSVRMVGGRGWIPSPVPAAKVFSLVFETENPEVVDRYDPVPTVWNVAGQVGPDSPNGAIVVEGMVSDGTYGVVIWSAD